MSRRSIHDWRRAVFKSDISPNVRLLLIYMADHMREQNKRVSVPRSQMAKALGWAEQRVSERIKQAIDAGFLDTVEPGYRGHTAVYQGLFPDVVETESVRENRSLSQPRKHGRFDRVMRPQNTDTSSRDNRFLGGDHRDKRSNEERVPTEVVSELTACPWHDDMPCPSDCRFAPANQRESA